VNGAEHPVLVEGRGLVKEFSAAADWLRRSARKIRAVDGVDLEVRSGETLGLVGESGSGKSTLGRLLIRLLEPDAGSVRFDGTDVTALGARDLRRMRKQFQIVFQDPYGSLNPRMRVGTLVGEPLVIHAIGASRAERGERVAQLLREVGLDPEAARRYPHEFSGGQRQRIGIARALACSPRFVVCDEPVSALDPPVAAQIVNLLGDLQERHGLTYLFVAHDLRLVRHFADRIVVLYLGKVVERGPAAEVLREPLHPYTRALRASVPAGRPGEPTEPAVTGEPPSASAIPAGCRFHPRCPVAVAACSKVEPMLLPAEGGREVACHLVHPPS
jgi:oligopeptide/dipeptide ABC transporter ATP-binding protein